jgi:sigma-B regulation protein RsbQ
MEQASRIFERNQVQVFGSGERTIVLAHGFGCDQRMWRYVAPVLAEDYRVVTFDFVGSGRSDLTAYDEARYGTLHGYARDILDVLEALDIGKVVFVGHSAGAMAGLLASIEAPERFERLALIGPSPCYLNEPPDYAGGFDRSDLAELMKMMEMNFLGWASHMAPFAMNDPARPDLSEELALSFGSTDPNITRHFAEVVFYSDHREDLARVAVPTLILQCAEDSIVPIEAGEYMHRRLRHSTLRVLRTRGHYPHLSHPAETVGAIQSYLRLA